MYLKTFVSILIIALLQVCTGTDECANRVENRDVEYLIAHAAARSVKTPSAYSERASSSYSSSSPRYAVLKHYIIKKSSGDAATNQGDILARTAAANNLYSTGPYRFVLDTTDTIVSDQDYDFKLFDRDSEVSARYNLPDRLNIYWANTLCSSAGSCYCGYAYYPWYNLRQTAILNSNCGTNILAHELGHNLGLLHTHETSSGFELVDESNCARAGDQVCDTNADPNLSSKVNKECQYIATNKDSNGAYYNPPVNNVMSYTLDACRTEFTAQQWQRATLFPSDISSVFVDMSMDVSTENLTDVNQIRVYASSTHTPTSWTVNVIGLDPVVSSTPSKIFSTVLENLPLGIYEIQVTACYSYTNPDGSNFCQTQGKYVSFLMGSNPGTPGTIDTNAPAQSQSAPCSIDTERSVAFNSQQDSFTIQSKRVTCAVDQFNVTMSHTNMLLGIDFNYLMGQNSFDYKVNFLSIVEYTENGTQSGYQPGQDSVVQTWTQDSWQPWYGPYNGDGSSLEFNTTADVIWVTGFISNAPTFLTENDYQLHPNEVKLKLKIDFTSAYKSRTGSSQLAIETRIVSNRVMNRGSNSITLEGDQPGIFKWPDSGKNGKGESVDILASEMTKVSDNEWKMWFSIDSRERTSFEFSPSVSVENHPPEDKEESFATKNVVSALLILMLILCALV